MDRRREWTARARLEVHRSQRTWFGTLTLAPHVHARLINECRAREGRSGVDFDALSDNERLNLLHRRINVEITKFLKRVRKRSGADLKYLWVMETVASHQNGLPHYHALVHERAGSRPCTYDHLQDEWRMIVTKDGDDKPVFGRLGFSMWKLLSEPKMVSYVTKYINKDTGARVRASVAYGEPTPLPDATGIVKSSLQEHATPPGGAGSRPQTEVAA